MFALMKDERKLQYIMYSFFKCMRVGHDFLTHFTHIVNLTIQTVINCQVSIRYQLDFINTGYFTSDNVPDGIKNATHNTFSNFRKKLATEIKISSFFRKWLNTNKRLFNI
jgi:hypothetical protein